MAAGAHRIVLLTGGWAHEPAPADGRLQALLGSWALDVEAVDEMGSAAAAVDDRCALLAVNACWFPMTDDRYSDEQRAAHARSCPPELREAIGRHVAAGRPVLGLHTAPICFDDWPGWGELLGARWAWGGSDHPPPAEVPVRPVDHPLAAGLAPFVVYDERYAGLEETAGRSVVAVSDGPDGSEPLVWTRREGGARIAVDLLGHDDRSYRAGGHAELFGRLVGWCLGGEG
jgi:uncharacterized protein